MPDVITAPSTLLYLLQINLLWSIAFLLVWLVVRDQKPTFRYASLLTCQLLLPVATILSILIFNLQADEGSHFEVTYTIFQSTYVQQVIPQAVAHSANPIASLSPILLGLIMAGSLLMIWRGALRLMRLYTLQGSSDPQLTQLLLKLKQQLSIDQRVSLVLTRLLHVPCSFGWLHNFIIMPSRLKADLSQDELRMIFAHELVHIQRFDFLINLLQKLTLMLFFYNPLMYWCDRQICNDREAICDDATLATGLFSRKSYAQTLLKVSLLVQPSLRFEPAIPFYRTSSQLRGRINMIHQNQAAKISRYRYITAISILFACFLGIACSSIDALDEPNSQTLKNGRYSVEVKGNYVDVTENGKTIRYKLPAEDLATILQPSTETLEEFLGEGHSWSARRAMEIWMESKQLVDDQLQRLKTSENVVDTNDPKYVAEKELLESQLTMLKHQYNNLVELEAIQKERLVEVGEAFGDAKSGLAKFSLTSSLFERLKRDKLLPIHTTKMQLTLYKDSIVLNGRSLSDENFETYHAFIVKEIGPENLEYPLELDIIIEYDNK